jgi:hypothetical protein
VRLSTPQVSRRIVPMARLPEFSEPTFGPR